MDTNPSNKPIHLVLEVTDHESLQTVLRTLNESECTVETKAITESGISEKTTVELDVDVLTSKQRQAVALAIEEGYYSRPRGASLEDLASELDISKSAVSQRLRTAERKLIKTAFEQHI